MTSWCVCPAGVCSPAHAIDSVQDGTTALYVAAQNGHLRVVELLLAAKADVNIQTNVSHIDGVCVLADSVVECVY